METDKIVERILDESDLDKEELEEEVEEKMEEFSGLVSEEGALHLVAKELGVEVAEENGQELKVENIVPDMRKVDVKARVVNISDISTFDREEGEKGKVQNLVLGDETGSIRLTLWDDQTEIAEKVDEDDVIVLESAYTVEDDRSNAELRIGDSTQVKKGEDDDVPEVDSSQTGEPSRADIREIKSENTNYLVSGMLMDVYTSNPFYSVDPETGDTVRENDDGEYVTDSGKKVEDPEKRLALSGVIDDGTGNIRVVMFRDTARKVLEIDEEAEVGGDIEKVEKAAEKARGKELQVEGRARYNDYFGRLELIANSVEEIGAEKRINQLLEQMEA